jgi:hypothetical protein
VPPLLALLALAFRACCNCPCCWRLRQAKLCPCLRSRGRAAGWLGLLAAGGLLLRSAAAGGTAAGSQQHLVAALSRSSAACSATG